MRDKVLMLDARHVFRKVTRKVFDFSPEQMRNLTSIVWLYRGEEDRFAGLVQDYLKTARTEAQAADFADLISALDIAESYLAKHTDTAELKAGIAKLEADAAAFTKDSGTLAEPEAEIAALIDARAAMQPMAEHAKVLIKEIDYLAKLAQKAQEAALAAGEKAGEGKKLLAAIAEARVPLTGDPNVHLSVTGTLKRARYFEGQAEWLLSRFPEGKLRDVEGLVKLVDQAELAANDYSLTPGGYVGVAPEVDDEDFDFEEKIKEVHLEIETLNAEATELAEIIMGNFEELIV